LCAEEQWRSVLKKQVLLLSMLVWGLVLFAPFTGDGGFGLAPWFDSAVSGGPTGGRDPVHVTHTTPAPVYDNGTQAAAENETVLSPETYVQQHAAPSLEQKWYGPGSEPVYLSYQDCQQQVTHSGIQYGGIQGSFSTTATSKENASESAMQNREPIGVSRQGGDATGWPGTPQVLPPSANGNDEGRQHQPGNFDRHRMRADDASPGSPYNDVKPPGPGGPWPSDVNPSVTP
jgi:hypothetical protein